MFQSNKWTITKFGFPIWKMFRNNVGMYINGKNRIGRSWILLIGCRLHVSKIKDEFGESVKNVRFSNSIL